MIGIRLHIPDTKTGTLQRLIKKATFICVINRITVTLHNTTLHLL